MKDDLKWRHEYKYIINSIQESLLKVRIDGVLSKDPYVNEDGKYIIRSLYFDDYEDTCLEENTSGIDPRSKIRVRYYNSDTGYIQLEKKIKSHGLCMKRSCRLTYDECKMLVMGNVPVVYSNMIEEKKELLSEIRIRRLKPTVIVTYERVPYVYDCGNVRITIDRLVTSSEDLNRFLLRDYRERPIFKTGRSILEVKWDYIMPEFLRDIVNVDNLERTAFSKYGMCRRFSI